jgi:endoglucanase
VQSDRLVALRDAKTGLYGSPPAYYDQNLALFSLAWSEDRYRLAGDGKLVVPWK